MLILYKLFGAPLLVVSWLVYKLRHFINTFNCTRAINLSYWIYKPNQLSGLPPTPPATLAVGRWEGRLMWSNGDQR